MSITHTRTRILNISAAAVVSGTIAYAIFQLFASLIVNILDSLCVAVCHSESTQHANLGHKVCYFSCSDPFYSCRYFCFCADSEENRGRFCRSNEIPMNVVTHTPQLSLDSCLRLMIMPRCLTAARLLPGNQTGFNKFYKLQVFQPIFARRAALAYLYLCDSQMCPLPT